jgi:hypothetical protein
MYRELLGHDEASLNKVVAAIFVDRNSLGKIERENFELIALASGSKHRSENIGIKDMHAEILVRRGLNRWMIDSKYTGGLRFHLYVSSAPCGNACIRRWATVKKEVFGEDEKLFGLCHQKISLHALKEGQIALTSKREGASELTEFLPTGVCRYTESGILSCSDKIAIFNAVGWTKLCLTQSLPRVDMSSITIGRKFARQHAQRAFCCRLQDSKIVTVNHPTLLCTAVKLDEGARYEDATFSDEVLVWSSGRFVERIDFTTGLKLDGEDSLYSTRNLQKCVLKSGLVDSAMQNLVAIKRKVKDFLVSRSF